MATHIHVELDTLDGLAKGLKSLSEEFTHAGDRVDGARAAIGAPTVKDAIDEFDDNWKIHRGRLVESIDAVHDMASESYDKFSEADEKLANMLLDDAPPSVGPTP